MWQILLTVVSIAAGAAIGWLIPWFDRIAYIYILHPEAQVAQYVKYQIGQKQFKTAWRSLSLRAADFDKLTTRGLLFQLAWVVLAFFAVTSSAGWFGKTLVLTLGIRILAEEWNEWFKDRATLKKKLFWQIQTEWNDQELKIYLIAMTAVVAWLVWLFL
jgi:hypothetical protein